MRGDTHFSILSIPFFFMRTGESLWSFALYGRDAIGNFLSFFLRKEIPRSVRRDRNELAAACRLQSRSAVWMKRLAIILISSASQREKWPPLCESHKNWMENKHIMICSFFRGAVVVVVVALIVKSAGYQEDFAGFYYSPSFFSRIFS